VDFVEKSVDNLDTQLAEKPKPGSLVPASSRVAESQVFMARHEAVFFD